MEIYIYSGNVWWYYNRLMDIWYGVWHNDGNILGNWQLCWKHVFPESINQQWSANWEFHHPKKVMKSPYTSSILGEASSITKHHQGFCYRNVNEAFPLGDSDLLSPAEVWGAPVEVLRKAVGCIAPHLCATVRYVPWTCRGATAGKGWRTSDWRKRLGRQQNNNTGTFSGIDPPNTIMFLTLLIAVMRFLLLLSRNSMVVQQHKGRSLSSI